MDDYIMKAVNVGNLKYPNNLRKLLEYGTAGFRDKAEVLPHIMYRMGLLAVLRSKADRGATIGVMVTASHNPEEDNGLKLCDPMGEMISPEWEVFATDLANAKNEELLSCLKRICDRGSIDLTTSASVFLAADTRTSSPALAAAVSDGVNILDGTLKDYGLLTTPQLHFMVCCKNTEGSYGTPTLDGYNKKLSSAFTKLHLDIKNNSYVAHVIVDGANGVGAHALKELIPHLGDKLKIEIFNSGETPLNYKCGADHVKVQQAVPSGAEIVFGKRYASLDGDADRLIYFFQDGNEKFHMLDGDKIATLVAQQIKALVRGSNLELQIRVIQTAYANGSSTTYIDKILGIPVICVPTGVKHLHHEALKYDIGIYFEANGHGTVVFGKNCKSKIRDRACDTSVLEAERKMAERLLSLIDLINETVGDAISDLLLVEIILQGLDWSISDWNQLYTDLPNRQLKLKVPDRRMITTTDADRICVKPDGLQCSINSLVAKYENARAFVRPSGTEDIVRVYAEASSQKDADLLAEQIAGKVTEFTSRQ